MSSEAAPVTHAQDATGAAQPVQTSLSSKGKGKEDISMEEDVEDDDDDEEEEEEEEEDEEDDEDVDDSLAEIDPSAIVSGRRSRAPVDYSSAEALAKAGLTKEDKEDEDESMAED